MLSVEYLRLVKPRIVLVVNFVGLAALIVAARAFPLMTILALLVAGSLASSAALAFNAYFDRDIDAAMHRTRNRPIPLGRIAPPVKAFYFGAILAASSLLLSFFTLNLLSTFFIALGIFVYVAVYTLWLKRRSVLNIVIGGFAGSCAALAGWAAVTGTIGLPAVLMALLVFLWTPSHFWSLALSIKEDYEKAGVPMLPSVIGEAKAARYIFLNTLVLVSFTALPYFLGFGMVYMALAMASGLALLYTSLRLLLEPTGKVAWKAYKFSSPYLAVVLTAMLLDALVSG